jgi:hypothetical protein
MQTGPAPYCTQTKVNMFRDSVERHEGATEASNSHVGIAQAALANPDSEFVKRFEKAYGFGHSGAMFAMSDIWESVDGLRVVPDSVLESDDEDFLDSLGCQFRY